MIIYYVDETFTVLHSQPQTTVPELGSAVVLLPPPDEPEAAPITYIVVRITRKMQRRQRGQDYFGLTDASTEEVYATLVEASQALTRLGVFPCP